ncbi:uncharacterized protein LOC129926574 [Biomphalaria glabrata]|uniref:Uncharacterized protein LOC129926574 n=1 Tax=Biomphalaria glabrata TaxID=6526 RepID=A0A9W3AJN0_BIOGL|nr:uncharacterized protein LOC129926574 [Biomphalaria glabrata]
MGMQKVKILVFFRTYIDIISTISVCIYCIVAYFVVHYAALLNTHHRQSPSLNVYSASSQNQNDSISKSLKDIKYVEDKLLWKYQSEKLTIKNSGYFDAERENICGKKCCIYLYLPSPRVFDPNRTNLIVCPMFSLNRLATYCPVLDVDLHDSVFFSTLSLHGFRYTGNGQSVTCEGCDNEVQLSRFDSEPSNASYHRNSSCSYVREENNTPEDIDVNAEDTREVNPVSNNEETMRETSQRYSQATEEDDVSTYNAHRRSTYEVTSASVGNTDNADNTLKNEESLATSELVGATSASNCSLTLRTFEGYSVGNFSYHREYRTKRTSNGGTATLPQDHTDHRRNLNVRENRVVDACYDADLELDYQIERLSNRTGFVRYNCSSVSERKKSFTNLRLVNVNGWIQEWAEKGLFCSDHEDKIVHCIHCHWSRCLDDWNSEVIQSLRDHSCHCDRPHSKTEKSKPLSKGKRH